MFPVIKFRSSSILGHITWRAPELWPFVFLHFSHFLVRSLTWSFSIGSSPDCVHTFLSITLAWVRFWAISLEKPPSYDHFFIFRTFFCPLSNLIIFHPIITRFSTHVPCHEISLKIDLEPYRMKITRVVTISLFFPIFLSTLLLYHFSFDHHQIFYSNGPDLVGPWVLVLSLFT